MVKAAFFLIRTMGKFAGCEALVFVGEDQTTTTTASPESSGTEEEKDTEEEDNERFLRKEGREGDDDDDDEKDEEDDSEKDDEDRERTSSTTTTTTTTPKPSRGPLLVLVKKSGGICYVTSATEYMGGHYEQDPTLTEQWRSIEHLFSPSLLLQAKNWFMDEARLFGYKFGGKNSPLCRVLSYFV
ncbi:uncharacterized protein LOC135095617 [Scylla paramamosain]|uniref:uncharacterized protein LOC135095617 n=1 Tax=Scylla paramamosain TaxID=85552 RepID=UPI003083731F